jgi:hypothetical protein
MINCFLSFQCILFGSCIFGVIAALFTGVFGAVPVEKAGIILDEISPV